jgi:hypothetical protein
VVAVGFDLRRRTRRATVLTDFDCGFHN